METETKEPPVKGALIYQPQGAAGKSMLSGQSIYIMVALMAAHIVITAEGC